MPLNVPSNIPLAWKNSNGFLDVAKRRPALVKDRPPLKGAYFEALGGDGCFFDKDGKTRTSRWTSGSFFCAGSGLELKNTEKGKIVRPWSILLTRSAGSRPW